jgi:hypothetical protein
MHGRAALKASTPGGDASARRSPRIEARTIARPAASVRVRIETAPARHDARQPEQGADVRRVDADAKRDLVHGADEGF